MIVKLNIYFLLFIAIFFISGCNEEMAKTPKPHMYSRIIFPERGYQHFDSMLCNFTFKYPLYSKIIKDSVQFEGRPPNNCWFDINSRDLNTSIHCSYYNISQQKNLSTLIAEAFEIADKHNIKANFRKETVIKNASGVQGILFDIEGPVASPVQFYLTDGKQHFFRASFYFNSKVNPDSTAIVLKFVKQDIDTLISTFIWK
ncbi:MAG: hypothetical protein IPO92_01525 [Saprospiraceae bacterium]|nr:hypothetical protein [Saprospiraceae bacterium]